MTIPIRDAGTVALFLALLWGLLLLALIVAVIVEDVRRQRAHVLRIAGGR